MELGLLTELEGVVQRLKAVAAPQADPVELAKKVNALQKRLDNLERSADAQRADMDDFMCMTVFLCGALFCAMMLFHTAILKRVNVLSRPIHIVARAPSTELPVEEKAVS